MCSAKLYRSAPLATSLDVEERLEKKADINSVSSSINKLKEIITYSKEECRTSKEKYNFYTVSSTILNTIHTFFIIATDSCSVKISKNGFGLFVIPIPTDNASGLASTETIL